LPLVVLLVAHMQPRRPIERRGFTLKHSALASGRESMKKLQKRAKTVGLEIRKVSGKFRLWNARTGSHLDLKKKRRMKQLLRWLQHRKR
jgi:hypothetical protein